MTREELILAHAEEYATDYPPKGITDVFVNTDKEKAFIDGAHWADNNPRALWRDTHKQHPILNEKGESEYVLCIAPSIPGYIIGKYCEGALDRGMRWLTDRFGWLDDSEIKYWCPLPQRPKKGE